ncbi:hypothetical protein M378DRAFT_174425 [Amanita muscaria Koide BX008]|uniref:Protein kinase domain-containing protein n=1 Tax=Amanita muscaria (strain Koide BX008) TaxID=946122 RepID=A0A0C2SJQ5_AMAMK|nr:hypothetical protein M378DRAFT_174425 [Amanita muscaria Koide BX008]
MAYPRQPTRFRNYSDIVSSESRKKCSLLLWLRSCPWLLSARQRPVQTFGSTHAPLSSPVLSLLVDPPPGTIALGPTSVDVVLSNLLKILRDKQVPTLNMMEVLGLVLNADDFVSLANKIDDQQDAESLIEMLLYLFDKDLMGKICVTRINANSRARRLIIKMAARLTTAPKSLFLNPDEIPIPSGLPIDSGGLAFVYKSSYHGAQVALKRVRSCKLDKAFLQEALTWRTLSHKYILPFIGIFVESSQSFFSLVAPFMENGTLRDWRRNMTPSIPEIKKRIQEVAEGLVYLHTEGIVHGDLKGSNVLLDSEFHVKISDFGSTKHTDSTATKTWAMTIRFSAPELFSDEEDQALWKRTKETDIYAFGPVL